MGRLQKVCNRHEGSLMLHACHVKVILILKMDHVWRETQVQDKKHFTTGYKGGLHTDGLQIKNVFYCFDEQDFPNPHPLSAKFHFSSTFQFHSHLKMFCVFMFHLIQSLITRTCRYICLYGCWKYSLMYGVIQRDPLSNVHISSLGKK